MLVSVIHNIFIKIFLIISIHLVEGDFITKGLFGGNITNIPFPMVSNWRREMVPIIKKAHHDRKWAEEAQKNVVQWWNEYKIELRKVFRDVVDSVMNDILENFE